MSQSDYTVIGSGIIGLLTARELAQQGASVTLLERGEHARSASWAGGGILSPLDPANYPAAIEPLVDYGQANYAELADALFDVSGIDSNYWQSGYLHLANSDVDHRHDDPAALVSALNVPNMPDDANAAWYPDVAQIRNPRLLKALIRDVKKHGVKLSAHTPVKALRVKQGRVVGLDTEIETLPVQNVVICAGAWTRRLLASANVAVKTSAIKPVRGQMLLLDTPPEWLATMVNVGSAYLIPRQGGGLLIGSTCEQAGYDDNPNEAGAEYLLTQVEQYFPSIRDFEIKLQWAGLRPGHADGVPLISHHPELDNCWVNAGHHRNGLLLAPASAKLCANLILKDTPCVPPEPYQF